MAGMLAAVGFAMTIWPALNQRICDVYGLDPMQVRRIVVDFRPNCHPEITVFLNASEGAMEVVFRCIENGQNVNS